MIRTVSPEHASRHVAIAVATRNRPQMLRACLDSLCRMVVPDGVRITYLIVDNDTEPTAAPAVDILAGRLNAPHAAILLHEPRSGIPFARNRALDAAMDRACQWLVFVDDDETVDPGWLGPLLSETEKRGWDLAAGPVVPMKPEGPLTRRQQVVFDQLDTEARRRRNLRQRRVSAGQGNRNDLATNNWIGRVAALRDAGLRFDETMRYTGGTDTDLSRRARQAGLSLGWVPDALVYEIVPHDRLTLGYVYRRSRSQTLAKYRMRYRKQGRARIWRPAITAALKAVLGALRVAVGIVTGGRSLVSGMRTLGVAAGYLQGILGRESDFYVRIRGN